MLEIFYLVSIIGFMGGIFYFSGRDKGNGNREIRGVDMFLFGFLVLLFYFV